MESFQTHPDPSVEKNLADVKEALNSGGDIAFAYDGDADRVAVLTHKYNVKGDQLGNPICQAYGQANGDWRG